jgi:hypothetical protein
VGVEWILWLLEPNEHDSLTLYRLDVVISASGYAELGEGSPKAWRKLLSGARQMIRDHAETS